ncbi:hypothetical protein DV737_g2094, partial [Chaetothyriales sp. CBS 132003]
MAEDGDNDPVVASYNVILNAPAPTPPPVDGALVDGAPVDGAPVDGAGSAPAVDSRLVILQYPAFRPHHRPYNARRNQKPRSLRLKPKTGMLEVDVPLLRQWDYNPDAAARYGRALAESKTMQVGASHGLGGGFSNGPAQYSVPPLQAVPAHSEAAIEEAAALDTQTLAGKMAVPSEQDPVYFLAAFRHGALHLSPVDAVVQMRPQLHHIDAEDENTHLKRLSPASAAGVAANGTKATSGGIESKAIEIKMKDTKDDGRDKGLNEGARLLRSIQAETWRSHEWIDQDDAAAQAEREKLSHCDASPTRLRSCLNNGDWLDRMSAPREDGKKGLLAKLRGRERERARRKKAEEEKKRKPKPAVARASAKSGALLEQSSDSDTSITTPAMLTRAARRRHTVRYLQHVADCLQLPFLCPAIASTHVRHRPHASIAGRQSSPSAARAPAAPATHAAFSSPSFYPSGLPIAQRRPSTTPSISPWDPASFLYIDITTASAPEQLNTNQVAGTELRGNAIEVQHHLEACLHLRKWPRAFANLRQLALLYCGNREKLRFLYNRTLAHMVDDLIDNHSPENEQTISQWIEREMKRADLEPNAYTFALVIKAALSSRDRSKRERTVRRYWYMAKRDNLQSEVGGLRDILNERDLGAISSICPLEIDDIDFKDAKADTEPDIILAQDVVAQRRSADIKEMEQKGLGLVSLRQTLALFSDTKDQSRLHATTDPVERDEHAVCRQRRLERDAIDSAIHRWRIEHEKMAKMGIAGNLSHGTAGALLWQWHNALSAKIEAELDKVKVAEAKDKKTAQDRLRVEYGPFLQQMEPTKLAAVTTIALMQIMSKAGTSRSIKLVRLVTDLGRIVEAECAAERSSKKRRQKSSQRAPLADAVPVPSASEADNANPGVAKPIFYCQSSNRNAWHASTKVLRHSDWTVAIQAKVGAILCELMFDTAKLSIARKHPTTGKVMNVPQPIFLRQIVYSNGRKIGVVSLHEEFVKILSREPAGDLIAKQLPMVCKPRPWTGFTQGGYLESDHPVMRIKNAEFLQKDYAMAAAERGDLDQLFAGLDVLGATAWKINRAVFDVMAEAWNSGEAVANLPPLNKHVDLPPRPPKDAPVREKWEWFNKVRAIENEKGGHHSNRCFQNFQLEIAKAYLDETFYLPHNIDFRGRAYPLPPYLNQMGADNCRGLMLFAKGRALGEHGLRWLKIHLANVYGYDKASLDDRAQFPLDHIDDIRDSVQNPLGGKRWWLTAEDPWQCLATCHELLNALDSPEPANFVSHLPIHQDGSCNGLQHYAALGGDIAGARQVNLEPGNKPADVYTGVADLVKAEIVLDAQKGNELAKKLVGRVTRKIVKQTVMTNVYGVTFLGAIRQVRKQVDSIFPEFIQVRRSGTAAAYIARKIFNALGALFTGAHEIQYWLGDCANRISASISPAQLELISQRTSLSDQVLAPKPGRRVQRAKKQKETLDPAAFRTSVIWTTPLKLPVVQPYRINKSAKISTNLQQITLVEPSVADAVHKKKQLQAFPPNFIHSLDATHMILSALKADELGLSFSAVHDSFWTHAADVNTLNTLLREAFIRMHSEDIVGRLAAEFRMRYQGHLYMAQVSKSSKVGKAIEAYRAEMADNGQLPRGHGVTAVKEKKYAELVREVKRRQLLASDKPEERKAGEDMVTAATLFDKFDGELYISSRDSLGETAIGALPRDASEKRIEEALNNGDVGPDVNFHDDTLGPLVDSVAEAADAVDSEPAEGHNKESAKNLNSNNGVMNLPGLGLEEPEEVQSTQTVQHLLAKDSEWRFEVAVGKYVQVKILTGSAELFGTELVLSNPYIFTGTKAAIYTWQGCTFEVSGDVLQSEYTAEETPMNEYINVHFALESLRDQAKNPLRHGPRVLVLGPEDAGKTSLVKILAAYAIRSGRSPILANTDVREGVLSLPGTLTATVFKSLVDVEEGFGVAPMSGPNGTIPVKLPLVYYYGSEKPDDKNGKVYKAQLSRLALATAGRMSQDSEAREAGLIIDTPGALTTSPIGNDIISHIVSEFSVNCIICIGSERLYSDMVKRFDSLPVPTAHFSQPATPESLAVVKVTKSGGCVSRDLVYMTAYRAAQIKAYFYGNSRLSSGIALQPRQQQVDFSSLVVWQRLGSFSADALSNMGSQADYDPEEFLPGDYQPPPATESKVPLPASQIFERITQPSPAMRSCVLAIMNCDPEASQEEIRDATVMGFLYVTDVDDTRGKISLLSPVAGRVPNRAIVCTEQASKHGFLEDPGSWANLGQGAPEVDDEIEGCFPRPESIPLSVNAREYGPTAGIKPLRAAIANLYNSDYRKGKESQYTWENVCVVPGGRAGLIRIAAMLSLFKSFVAIPSPLSGEDGYHIHADKIAEELARGTSVILTSNPRNPTGHALSSEELQLIQDICRDRATLIFDEFYAGYDYRRNCDGTTISAASNIIDVNRDDVVLIDGLTKRFRLPGWRVAWIVGPKEFIDALASCGSYLDGGTNVAFQEAAVEMLDPPKVHKEMKALQTHFKAKRDYVLKRLHEIGFRSGDQSPPDSTFYIWLDLSTLDPPIPPNSGIDISNGLSFFDALLKEKTIVVPGIFFDLNPAHRRDLFDSPCHHFVRISYGPKLEVLKHGMDGIERVVKQARGEIGGGITEAAAHLFPSVIQEDPEHTSAIAD